MTDINKSQPQIKNDQPTDKINFPSVIQKHHDGQHDSLNKIFYALARTFQEANNITTHSDPNYLIEKLRLLFRETDKIDENLKKENWQSHHFITHIVDTLKFHCSEIYRDLHILFTKTEDAQEKKDLIASSFMVGTTLDHYMGLETLFKASNNLIPITSQEIKIKDLIGDIINNLKPIACYRQSLVDYKLATDMPELIVSDLYRVKLILECLIKDAIKICHNLNIFLTVNFFKSNEEVRQRENTDFILHVILRNNCTIYSQELQETLKDEIATFDHFNINKYKMLGVDLCLVRYFVSNMGGSFEMEVDKKGSSFICHIPVSLPTNIKNNISGE